MNGTEIPGSVDWGPFGRPLFNDPSARALARVGVVDVGSNSVRLVVFDGAARSPAYFYNEKIMCALGQGLSETGKLNPQGRARALSALRRFQHLAEGMGIAPLTAVATAAVREASDGPAFCQEVLEQTGLKIHVIDGLEEARLSAQGVMLGWPGAYGLICDIGGASMELAEIAGGTVGRCVTSPLGPLKLAAIKGGKKGRRAHIRKVLNDLAPQLGPQENRLFLVGGSWRAIARNRYGTAWLPAACAARIPHEPQIRSRDAALYFRNRRPRKIARHCRCICQPHGLGADGRRSAARSDQRV